MDTLGLYGLFVVTSSHMLLLKISLALLRGLMMKQETSSQELIYWGLKKRTRKAFGMRKKEKDTDSQGSPDRDGGKKANGAPNGFYAEIDWERYDRHPQCSAVGAQDAQSYFGMFRFDVGLVFQARVRCELWRLSVSGKLQRSLTLVHSAVCVDVGSSAW
ncbi:hypothetical protein NDU88_002509 [Pleurodeles waltl]|uniref:Uncharacterized protein n=1 Tax=Pleurodeles waltl TaxID=8319 RepID=A0AAV7T3H6_PLEWA|nr:hypothetical protein NDU88_002509 [Pleurodeles waltl]